MRLALLVLLLLTACEQQVERIETDRLPKYMGIPLRDCGHLYDINKHKAWAECMGVGYE